jgi:response regulator RpfG family c-di-GMP phosphodiesterase
LPIIAITSHPEHTVLKKCLEAGMDDCLTKPIRSSDLNQTIREWLGQSENDPGFPATSRNNTAQEIPAVLDENQIHETILYIGNDSLVDMFENFKRDIGLQIESLDSGKSLSIAELHHLGTSSSYMGLWRIKQLCDAMITYLSAENNKSATPDLAAELKDEFHIGLNALNDYMFKSGLLQ